MARHIARWLLNALALMAVAYLIPNITVTFWAALLAALVIGAINTILRPVLVLLTLPVTILTLGLFLFVINAFLFWLAGVLVPGFVIDGFGAALVGSILYSILSWIITSITRGTRESQRSAGAF